MFDSTTDFIHIFVNILTGWKKSHCKKAGLENSEDIHCQSSIFKMTNGIRKVRLGVDFFDKRTLDFSKFISDTVLQNTALSTAIFPCSRLSINRFHSAWCTTYGYSTFYVLIFVVSGKREREERERNPSFSALLFFYFWQEGGGREP